MVEDILEDHRGNLWFASGMPPGQEGLCRFDGTSISQFLLGGQRWIRTIREDRDGSLWFGTRSLGVWRYDGKAFAPFNQHLKLGAPRLIDRSHNVWFAGEEAENGLNSESGIWRYDGKTFRNFSIKDGMGGYSVWCMLEDKAGNIWVGTRGMGLYRYDGKSFVRFSK